MIKHSLEITVIFWWSVIRSTMWSALPSALVERDISAQVLTAQAGRPKPLPVAIIGDARAEKW
jgi:hypothetical protein